MRPFTTRGPLLGAWLLLLGLASCTKTTPDEDIGRQVQFEPPPPQDLDALGLPKAPDGGYVVTEEPLQLLIDPAQRDEVTAYGGCLDWVSQCVSPPERTLDDCARSAPTCQTTRPWEEARGCCPADCFHAYATRRHQGISDDDSFEQVYLTDLSCFPGLNALVPDGGL